VTVADEKQHVSMNINERMIWAAVFAKERDLHNPPRHVIGPGPDKAKEWIEWERGQIHCAVEIAGGAITQLREELESIKEGFFDDSDVYLFLAEMLGVKTESKTEGEKVEVCKACGSPTNELSEGCTRMIHRWTHSSFASRMKEDEK